MSDRPPRQIDAVSGAAALPLVVSTMLRPQGNTGVHTHFQQFLKYLSTDATATATLVTPFSWGGPLYLPVFGVRHALSRVSGSADVFWHQYWHGVFLRRALRDQLAGLGDCVIYAQDPPTVRAALAARRDRRQQVVLAVHFRISEAEEWADKGMISRDSRMFRNIQQVEREVIPCVDRLVYVPNWAKEALLGWLPEAAAVPSAVIGNFVAPWHRAGVEARHGDLVTVGGLEPVKNHRFLLHVLAAAKQAGHALTLDIFGDGPLRGELQQLARGLDLAEQVRFRGFQRGVRDFLPGYRAYVHASYSESSSLAIMEAMDAGLPIVAAPIGPLAELVDDGVEGRFWSLEDPAQAAGVLLELLADGPVRRKAARAARERFERDFNAAVIAPRLKSFVLGGK
jgi:glycosyltransferase involved in cell wall biosynthesis